MKKGQMRLDNYKPQQSLPFKSSNNKFFKGQRNNQNLERIEEELSGFSSMNNANVSQFDTSNSFVFCDIMGMMWFGQEMRCIYSYDINKFINY